MPLAFSVHLENRIWLKVIHQFHEAFGSLWFWFCAESEILMWHLLPGIASCSQPADQHSHSTAQAHIGSASTWLVSQQVAITARHTVHTGRPGAAHTFPQFTQPCASIESRDCNCRYSVWAELSVELHHGAQQPWRLLTVQGRHNLRA
jgi:hypothetical protein